MNRMSVQAIPRKTKDHLKRSETLDRADQEAAWKKYDAASSSARRDRFFYGFFNLFQRLYTRSILLWRVFSLNHT